MRRSHRRAGLEPRRVARERTFQQLFSWPAAVGLTAGAAFIITVLVGAQALFGVTGHRMGPGLSGFFLGCGLASVAWVVWEAATSTDGSWTWRVGVLAERWTSEEVRRLGRRWRFRYNMVFYDGTIEQKRWVTDIDCVATGPHGVLAISTKWTSDPWDLNDPQDDWLLVAAKQASRNASKLIGPVHQPVPHAPVVPLVVCWGPRLERIERGVSRVTIDDTEVLVVYGPQSREWLATFDTQCLNDVEISAIDDVVGRWIDAYEDRNARTSAAKSRARVAARRTAWATRAGIVATIGAITWMVAASTSRSVLHVFTSFVRLGDGTGGALYILVPTVLLAGSAAFAFKATTWSARARLTTNSRLVLIESLVGLGTWLITLAVAWIAS